MNRKLTIAILSPLALTAVLIAVSEAKPQIPAVTGGFGVGPAKVTNNPARQVIRHDAEEVFDAASGSMYLHEEIEYEDGPESRYRLFPSEFIPQFAPLDPVPPSCSLNVVSATIQGNTAAGSVHAEANVLCARVGGGNTPCDQVHATFYGDRLELGIWRNKTYFEYRDTPGCGETCPNLYVNATINAPGVYRFTFTGFNGRTNTTIWQPLVIYMQYPG